MRWKRQPDVCCARILALACIFSGFAVGCGSGERMETGTQVEVSPDMLEEARNADAYFDSQKKAPAR